MMILPKVRGVREAFHNPEMYEADSFFGIRRPRNKFRRGNKTSEYETTQPYMTRKPKLISPDIVEVRLQAKNTSRRSLYFYLPKSILYPRSKYVSDKAYRKLVLSGVDEETFTNYAHLLPNNEVLLHRKRADDASWLPTIKLFLLADCLRDSVSANLIIDQVAAMLGRTGPPPPEAIDAIYAAKEAAIPLRRLVISYAVDAWPSDTFCETMVRSITCSAMKDFARDKSFERGGEDGGGLRSGFWAREWAKVVHVKGYT